MKQCWALSCTLEPPPLFLLLGGWSCLCPTETRHHHAWFRRYREQSLQGLFPGGLLHTAALFEQDSEFNTVDGARWPLSLFSALDCSLALRPVVQRGLLLWAEPRAHRPVLSTKDGSLVHAVACIMPEDCLRKCELSSDNSIRNCSNDFTV